MARKARIDGQRSRRRILDAAAALASRVGLEGLSIGALAREVGMTKGGITAHFPAKVDLQLAAVGHAQAIFAREVLDPAAAAAPGRAWLLAVAEADLDYFRRRVFPGGCFFSAASAEYCGREGPVRDRIAAVDAEWLAALTEHVRLAVDAGELPAGVVPRQLAFEINGLLVSANFAHMLHGDTAALDRAWLAIQERLSAA